MTPGLPEKLSAALQPFIPAEAVPLAVEFIIRHRVQLTVTRGRATKLGDYRHPYLGEGHRVTVNGTLNQYAFLVTLVHEFAHLTTWEAHKNGVKPHGSEWKNQFTLLMKPYLTETIFPASLLEVLYQYFKNPRASSCADPELMRELANYDKKRDNYDFLEELPEGAVFMTRQRRYFKKGEKRRTRFLCYELSTRRAYLFHPLTPVQEQKG